MNLKNMSFDQLAQELGRLGEINLSLHGHITELQHAMSVNDLSAKKVSLEIKKRIAKMEKAK